MTYDTMVAIKELEFAVGDLERVCKANSDRSPGEPLDVRVRRQRIETHACFALGSVSRALERLKRATVPEEQTAELQEGAA